MVEALVGLVAQSQGREAPVMTYIIIATYPNAPPYYRSMRDTWVGALCIDEARTYRSKIQAENAASLLQMILPGRTVKAIPA